MSNVPIDLVETKAIYVRTSTSEPGEEAAQVQGVSSCESGPKKGRSGEEDIP